MTDATCALSGETCPKSHMMVVGFKTVGLKIISKTENWGATKGRWKTVRDYVKEIMCTNAQYLISSLKIFEYILKKSFSCRLILFVWFTFTVCHSKLYVTAPTLRWSAALHILSCVCSAVLCQSAIFSEEVHSSADAVAAF